MCRSEWRAKLATRLLVSGCMTMCVRAPAGWRGTLNSAAACIFICRMGIIMKICLRRRSPSIAASVLTKLTTRVQFFAGNTSCSPPSNRWWNADDSARSLTNANLLELSGWQNVRQKSKFRRAIQYCWAAQQSAGERYRTRISRPRALPQTLTATRQE